MSEQNAISLAAQLPRHAIGDHSPLFTDLSEAVEVLESGDLDDYNEEGDYTADETGGPKINFGRLSARLALKKPKAQAAIKALQRKNPRAANIALNAAKARAAAKTRWATFEHLAGAKLIASDLGLVAPKMRNFEVTAIKTHFTEFPLVAPSVATFTLTLGAGTLDIGQILNTVYGITAGTLARFIGGILTFSVSDLNRAGGTQVAITRVIGSTQVRSVIELGAARSIARFTFVNGAIVAGRARYFGPVLAASATPTGVATVAVSGLNTGYNAQLRLFIVGDAPAERFLELL